MDSDWVCKGCRIRVAREHQHGSGGQVLSTKETLEEFKARLSSAWEEWRKIPKECRGNNL
jgi:hypothetical protein